MTTQPITPLFTRRKTAWDSARDWQRPDLPLDWYIRFEEQTLQVIDTWRQLLKEGTSAQDLRRTLS